MRLMHLRYKKMKNHLKIQIYSIAIFRVIFYDFVKR